MALAVAYPATDSSDPISNAVLSQEGSLFVRLILQSALIPPPTPTPAWAPEAQALLANVLMNDYFNSWNNSGKTVLTAAQTAAAQAGTTSALGCHAQGLVQRADRTLQSQKAALKSFRKARSLDFSLARVHAQFANQKVLLGREQEAHAPLDRARQLSPQHPACGYFYWADGRAYFQEQIWSNAIYWLTESVAALPTVWYNRCYLAAAQNSAPDPTTQAAAQGTMQDFINTLGRSALSLAVNSLQPRTGDPATVAAARATVLQFIRTF